MIPNERGQVLPLVIGFTLVVFAVAGVAVDGARIWLLRRGLQNSADSAVLAGAAQLDARAVYASGGTSSRLDSRAAFAAARSMLARRALVTSSEVTVQGDVVSAVVTARLRTSFLSLVGVEELRVAAEATATPVFGDPP